MMTQPQLLIGERDLTASPKPTFADQSIKSPERLPFHNLDFLRAIAVTCVVVSHLRTMFGSDWISWLNMPILGFSGVLIFFVHTSLVLMMSMRRMLPRCRARTFYIRRIFRIYPLSIVCVLVYVIFKIPYSPSASYVEPSSAKLLLNILLLQNVNKEPSIIGPLWSLPYEIQMYLVLPFLFTIGNRWRGSYWLIALYCCFAAASVGEILLFGHANISRYGPCFFGGVFSYQVARNVVRKLPAMGWPFCLLMCLLLMQVAMTPVLTQARPTMLMAWTSCAIVGLAIPCFEDSAVGWVNTICELIAKYSYGIYLTHEIALWIAFNRCSSFSIVSQWAIFTLLAVALAIVSYHLVERPMIEFGRRLADRLLVFTSAQVIGETAR